MTIEFNWTDAEHWPTVTLDEALADTGAWPDANGRWIWNDDHQDDTERNEDD